MLGRIADSIAVLFLKKNIINEDELPVYQYGMQVLICNIAGMLTVLIVGILISRLVESIIFITIYATLRIYTGGYHARTPLVCNIVFLGTYLVTVMLEALKVNNSVVWIMYLLSCLIILRFSPIENVNKELDEKCRRHVHIEVDNVEKASCILDERYPESQIKVYLRNVIKVFGYNKNISDITKELVYGGVGVEKIGYEGEDLEEYYTNLLSEVKSNETA